MERPQRRQQHGGGGGGVLYAVAENEYAVREKLIYIYACCMPFSEITHMQSQMQALLKSSLKGLGNATGLRTKKMNGATVVEMSHRAEEGVAGGRSSPSGSEQAMDSSYHSTVQVTVEGVVNEEPPPALETRPAAPFRTIPVSTGLSSAFTPRRNAAPSPLPTPPTEALRQAAEVEPPAVPQLGEINKWRTVLTSTLTILQAEKVSIKVSKKLGFRGAGLLGSDNATAQALTMVRMYGEGDANPLNSTVCMLDNNSYPFHMLAVLSLANGDVLRESTIKAFKKFDDIWTKIKTKSIELYEEDVLKIVLAEALGQHAEDAPIIYKRMLLISSYSGMEEKKATLFFKWVEEVEDLIYGTFQEMNETAYLKALEAEVAAGDKSSKKKLTAVREEDRAF